MPFAVPAEPFLCCWAWEVDLLTSGDLPQRIHELLPRAYVVKVFCPGAAAPAETDAGRGNCEVIAGPVDQAIQICQSWQESRRPQAARNEAQPIGRANLADD